MSNKPDTKKVEVATRISKTASTSDKTAFTRKINNMKALVAKIRPLEDEMLRLITEKRPIEDAINSLREEMVRDCVHPIQYITVQDDYTATCKFCNKRFSVSENV